jgi:hypothetical protein
MKISIFNIFWLLLLSVLYFVAAVLFFTLNWTFNPARYRFYYFNQTTYLLALVLIPCTIWLVIFVAWRRLRLNPKATLPRWGVTISLIILVVANFIACGAATYVLPFTLLHRYRQLDNIYVNNYLYRLDYESAPEVGGGISAGFYLLQCDSLGWMCEFVYSGDYYGHEILQKDFDLYSASGKLTLSADNKMIDIAIDGHFAYQYQIEK